MRIRKLIQNLRLSEKVRKYLLRIASAVLAVVLIVFCFYHFTRSPDSALQTMLITEDTVETTVVGEAILFRSETVVSAESTGLTVPLVSSGAHVAKDAALASVYAGGGEYTALYRVLTAYIDALKAAQNEKDALAHLTSLENEIQRLTSSLMGAIEQGDAGASAELASELRILYSRVQALIDKDFTLEELIASLELQREGLLAQAGAQQATLSAGQSGYYYPYADGYCELCSPEVLETLTGSDFLALAETLRGEEKPSSGAGTLVSEPTWYIAFATELSAEEIAALPVGESYPVIFPDEEDVRIPMTLERTVEGADAAPSLLIFSTLRMPDGFSFERLQTVHVVTGSIGGFSVPASAVHTLDGYRGVYVLEGNIMYFCRVEILHDLGVRYLVKTTDPTPGGEYTENTYRYVAQYDAMIISGTELFHGRVLS